jgi:uncharacterized protein (TIGR02569 family)
VRSAFGVPSEIAQPLSGGRGEAYRCGPAVLKPAHDHAETSWLAGVFEHLTVPDVRLARPIRASDGRWVVGSWAAHRFVTGHRAPRFAEVIRVGELLHGALVGVARPRFLAERHDVWSWADRVAWGEADDDDPRIGDGVAAAAFRRLVAGRRPVTATSQLVHGDLTGNVLFAGSAPPAVIDITPYWRPALWATAVVVVDAIAWGGADLDLAARDEPDWPEILRRALLYRLGVSVGHPNSTPASMVGMLSAVELLTPLLDR